MLKLVLYLHPAFMLLALALALWAFWLGLLRIGGKAVFPWKRHVWVGTAAVVLWIGGTVGTSFFHYMLTPNLHTGRHGQLAWWVAGFALFTLVTGCYMHKTPRPRKLLPAVHGLAGGVLLVMAVAQSWIGHELMNRMLATGAGA